jgi:outer membrane protein assembly factor BamA
MRRWTVPQLLVLGLAGLFFCDVNARAQSTSHYSCCTSNASCDGGMPFSDGGMPFSRRTPRIYIDSLTFDGPIHLSATRLKQILTTTKENKFNTDFTSPEAIEEWLRGPWLDEGYYKVKVGVEAKPVGGGYDGRYAITAHVDEGLQYRVGRIEFRAVPDSELDTSYSSTGITLSRGKPSNGDDSGFADSETLPFFPVGQLRSLMPLQEGDILNLEKVREGLDGLRKLYGDHGYIDFVPQPLTDVDDEHQIVSIHVDLVEEKQYRIGKIEVFGLDAKSESALIWKIKTGDVFNNELLQAFFEDNQSNFPAGSYWAEDPKIVRRPKTGIVDVEFTFKSCSGR